MDAQHSWEISGTYLESCNCHTICPCRRVGGKVGGRSEYGVCEGALSWAIERGSARDVDLGGLAVVLAFRYDDDEERSPWDFVLYLDERASDEQRAALEQLFTGALGGSALVHFPWAFKPSRPIAVRSVPIEVEHRERRGWFRAGDAVLVRVLDPVAEQPPVTCVIPGHHRDGAELAGDVVRVADGLLEFELDGRCGYQSTFDYSGAEQA